MKRHLKQLILFLVGGTIYYLIEILYRGYSHPTMFILGGICFRGLGEINEVLEWDTPLWKQSLIGGCIITILELITGLIVNVILKWNVWDYSNIPFNFFGQICLPFTIMWIFLSVVGIILDDYLRYWMFKEEKPRYKLF